MENIRLCAHNTVPIGAKVGEAMYMSDVADASAENDASCVQEWRTQDMRSQDGPDRRESRRSDVYE